MAQSRIEKFREYRKSIINNEMELTVKTPIETSLESTSTESKTLPSDKEAILLRKLTVRKHFTDTLFTTILAIVVILLVVFGLILFR